MGAIEELIDEIFAGKRSPLSDSFERWLRASRRFKTFATDNRGKIRAKLRQISDESGMKDLGAELETAAVLLREDRFALEYERYAALKQRGPDFTVTFKTHTPFNVEVRRIRRLELDEGDSETAREARINKLMAVVCEKSRQMPPSIVNVLWLVCEGEIALADVTGAVTRLRELAERKAEDYFARRGFTNAAEFLKHYRQVSAIVVRQSDSMAMWVNPLARHKLPGEIENAIGRI